MTGKLKGQFLVSASNGSRTGGQIPTMRVKLAASGVVVASLKFHRSNMIQYMRNQPASAERAELQRQMVAQGYSHNDVMTILSKD